MPWSVCRTPYARTGASRLWTAAVSLGVASLLLGGAAARAHEAHGHPARIHEGTCEELGTVAYRLNGVGGSVDLDNAPVATPTAVNPDASYQVMVSETAVDASLEEFMAADHAVMVYESDEAMEAIACGNVGGAMTGDALITGLAEMGVPGHLGFALFQPDGDGLAVSVIIGHALAPVSASGQSAEDSHDESAAGDDHAHEEDGDVAATPEA